MEKQVLAMESSTMPSIAISVCGWRWHAPALDCSSYDALPPFVRLVNPFTDEPYRAS
jgi:hypothetical protein